MTTTTVAAAAKRHIQYETLHRTLSLVPSPIRLGFDWHTSDVKVCVVSSSAVAKGENKSQLVAR